MMTTLSLKRVNLCKSESVMENTKEEAFGKMSDSMNSGLRKNRQHSQNNSNIES